MASDEDLVSIRLSPLALPQVRESPVDVMLRMAGVDDAADLGKRGPLIASAVNPENTSNPELRRYEARFGRDALYASEFLADAFPQLEDGTVRYFAAYQAASYDPLSQAEPGKVPNHVRSPTDPLAKRLTQLYGRRWPWYGGTDTTILFISAACRVVARNPESLDIPLRYPEDHERAGAQVSRGGDAMTLARAIEGAAAWLARKLRSRWGRSLVWAGLNRRDSFTVWTDSPNAFYHRNGELLRPPIAPIDLQSQAYEALTALTRLGAEHPRLDLDPDALSREASRIRQRILDHFIVSDQRGTFLGSALERVGDGLQAAAVRTVNMGFALDSSVLLDPSVRELRDAVIGHLLGPDMRSPFGIAGRARDEIRFETFDYHSQIYAFAVHKVARGLARHGRQREADALNDCILRQTSDGLLPENVGADDSSVLRYCPHILEVRRPAPDGRQTNTVKERPPAPYAAWTAAAVVAINRSRPGPEAGR